MTVEQAKAKLSACRSRQRELRRKITALEKYLCDKGIDPNPPAIDRDERNKAIYSRYLDGLTWTEIAAEFKLSKDRVKQISARVEKANERKARDGREVEQQ